MLEKTTTLSIFSSKGNRTVNLKFPTGFSTPDFFVETYQLTNYSFDGDQSILSRDLDFLTKIGNLLEIDENTTSYSIVALKSKKLLSFRQYSRTQGDFVSVEGKSVEYVNALEPEGSKTYGDWLTETASQIEKGVRQLDSISRTDSSLGHLTDWFKKKITNN